MALLIIDLENTCMPEHERPADYHGQIIEIGAAWVTPNKPAANTAPSGNIARRRPPIAIGDTANP